MPNTRQQNITEEASEELRKAIEPPNFKIGQHRGPQTRQTKHHETQPHHAPNVQINPINDTPSSSSSLPATAILHNQQQSSSLSSSSIRRSTASSQHSQTTQPNIYGHAHKISKREIKIKKCNGKIIRKCDEIKKKLMC